MSHPERKTPNIQMQGLLVNLKRNFKTRALTFVTPEVYEANIRGYFDDFIENLEEPLEQELLTAVENDSYLDYSDEES